MTIISPYHYIHLQFSRGAVLGMQDDLLHGHDLLPALLDGVVVLPHHDLPVAGLLPRVEAVAGAEHPHVTDQGAPAGVLPPPPSVFYLI